MMKATAVDWDRLKEIVADALDRPAGERTLFLREACGGDATLFEEAAALVSDEADDVADTCVLHPRTDSFLGLGGPDPSAMAGRRFGKYELQQLLGEGGMAAVYLARQAGMDRPVALKVLRPHAIAYDAQRRFGREVAAQGRIEHPAIAKIYDAGVEREGDLPGGRPVPYIAMEHVDGVPLTRFAALHNLGVADRLRLLADVADGVHAAHQRAIVHRDLKPANVLVENDGRYGRPKILDFGIARVLQSADEGTLDDGVAERARTLQTTAGVLLGTLGYMAPEQARGESDRVDVRSDVYALGVMLHELVVGELPVRVANLPLTEALRRLGEPDVDASAIVLPDDAPEADDLRAILSTALATEPERRYPSAEALAEDLRRLLRNEPVSARLPTRRYLARKFVRRHRAGVAAAAAVALALAGGATAATVGFVREAAARDTAEAAQAEAEAAQAEAEAALSRAELENRRANAARGFLDRILEATDAETEGGASDITLLEAIERAEPTLGEFTAGDRVVEADIRTTLARALRSLGRYDDADAQYRQAVAAFDARGDAYISPLGVFDILLEQGQMWANESQIEAAQEALAEAERRWQAAAAGPGDDPDARRIGWMFESTRASVLDAEGDYEKSADLWARLLDEAEALLSESGAGEPGTLDAGEYASALNNASGALISAGRLDEGLAHAREVVDFYGGLHGQAHPSTLRARHNFAYALQQAGRLDEAEAIEREALPEAEEALGEDHYITGGIRRGLATILVDRQSPAAFEEALALTDADLASSERRGDDDGFDYLMSLNTRATLLGYLDRHAEAAEAMERLIPLAESMFGDEHPTTLTLRSNLAQTRYNAGDKAGGRATLEELLDLQVGINGPTAQSTIITRSNLAMMMLADDDAAGAAKHLAEAVTAAEQTGWGAVTPIFRRNWARALLASGEVDAAREQFERAYEESAALGEAPQQRAAAYLAHLHAQAGDAAAAARWRALAGDAEIDLP